MNSKVTMQSGKKQAPTNISLKGRLQTLIASLYCSFITRKMYDTDPLNTLSSSTELVGAVDGVWVLEKEKRIGDKGKPTIPYWDIEG